MLGVNTSIVIPTYNAERTLAEAIETAFAQGVNGPRLIVVNDGSDDGSSEVARRYGERVTLVEKQNGGASSARNAGLARVSTQYVLFLDADDLYLGPIVAGFERAASATNADLTFGTTQDVDPDGTWRPNCQTPPNPSDTEAFLASWLGGHSVQTNSHFWRADFLRAIGGWNEDMKILEEIEVTARGILKGARIEVSLEGTSLYRHHPTITRAGYGGSERSVRSAVDGFTELIALAENWSATVRRSLGKRLYIQARTAYRLGYFTIGHEALEKARALGFIGHTGTRNHRLLAALLGLERKESLVRFVR